MVGNEVKFIIFRIDKVGERESEQSPRYAAAAESFSHVQRAEIRAQIFPFVKIVVNHARTRGNPSAFANNVPAGYAFRIIDIRPYAFEINPLRNRPMLRKEPGGGFGEIGPFA